MATVRHDIAEHDVVALSDPIGPWPVGTRGTVVSDYGQTKLIEISDHNGTTLDLVQAPLAKLDATR
ncbi:MAG TPA: hypothetical protein VEX36_06405 [Thermoleophilaceae bacterium]|nr:hypothetical protein [Thermoleophilaceae bacterium]